MAYGHTVTASSFSAGRFVSRFYVPIVESSRGRFVFITSVEYVFSLTVSSVARNTHVTQWFVQTDESCRRDIH